MNAGAAPAGYTLTVESAGGGRIIGEACHFIDLLRFLVCQPITGSVVSRTHGASGRSDDPSVCITLSFADGSLGTVHYLTDGHASFPKERVEVFAAGRVLQLDNFRRLRAFGWPGFRRQHLWRQDKGQNACAAAFVKSVGAGGASPIPLEEILEVSRTTIEVSRSGNGIEQPLPTIFTSLRVSASGGKIFGRARFKLGYGVPVRTNGPHRRCARARMIPSRRFAHPSPCSARHSSVFCTWMAIAQPRPIGTGCGKRMPQLWTYNLHYFDDLNAVAASSRRSWHESLLQRWIAGEIPPGVGTRVGSVSAVAARGELDQVVAWGESSDAQRAA